MQRYIHVYTNKLDFENEEVNLQEAFDALTSQETVDEFADNFIGFTDLEDDQNIIQFIRQTKKVWEIDIPTYTEKIYSGSLYSIINNDQVFSLVRDFFDNSNLIFTSLRERNYDAAVEYCKTRYGIVFELNLP